MIKKIINILYNSGVYLLISFGILLVLTTFLWLIKIPVTIFNLPISLFLSIVIFLIKEKDNKNKMILSIMVALLVFIISILISGHIFDQSDDGNSYHKETIGMLKSGWNPIWDDYIEFAEKNNLTSNHSMWAEHYPKTTWIIGSSIYILTGNIETAKCYNILILFIGFSLFLKYLSQLLNNKLVATIVSLIICINPITMSQILSLYVDGFMGILFYILIISMYMYVNEFRDYKLYLILSSTLILITNVKFTGLAYAGIFCLGYYLYYLYLKIKSKNLKDIKNSIVYFGVTIVLALFLVGSNSYVKNILDHGVPFYPLMGKDKVDIMTYLQPASFAEMSPIEKNYYSIFSNTANIGVFNNGEPKLKIPFTFSYYELYQITYDTRIGGYGIFFSGIFLVSLTIILFAIIKLIMKKDYRNLIYLLIPISIIIILLFLLSDGWWARYAPYLYLLVIISAVILGNIKLKGSKLLFVLFSLLIFVNSFINFAVLWRKDLPVSGLSRETFEQLEGKNIKLNLANARFSGILYNLKDYKIEYKINNELDENKLRLYGDYAYYVINNDEE